MTVLVDTLLYNPSVAVLNVDKEAGKVTVLDLFNDKKKRVLNLHESKQAKGNYYFKMNKNSYWLDCLFDNEERGAEKIDVRRYERAL